ncbi:MAG TPA: YceI family protein [Acidimicrobiia bacterium]|nr:YceI family protein [Acidimicrobiia bacterium]
MSAKLKYSLLGIAGVAVVAFGLFVYFGILSNDSPAEFSLEKGSTNNTAAAPPAGELAGTWTVAGASQAGYRVREKLASLPAPSDAVGRTTAITGQVTISEESGAYRAKNANFTVDVSQLKSNENRRDNRIRTIGLETDKYPQATFAAAGPIDITKDAVDGQVVTVQAAGDMTLHGVTKNVSIPLQVQRNGNQIRIVGNYDFSWDDFGMTAPSVPPFVSVTGSPKLEFDVMMSKQA